MEPSDPPALPNSQPGAASGQADPPADRSVRCVDSRALLGPLGQLLIRHDGRLYRLRITRQNRLILGI